MSLQRATAWLVHGTSWTRTISCTQDKGHNSQKTNFNNSSATTNMNSCRCPERESITAIFSVPSASCSLRFRRSWLVTNLRTSVHPGLTTALSGEGRSCSPSSGPPQRDGRLNRASHSSIRACGSASKTMRRGLNDVRRASAAPAPSGVAAATAQAPESSMRHPLSS